MDYKIAVQTRVAFSYHRGVVEFFLSHRHHNLDHTLDSHAGFDLHGLKQITDPGAEHDLNLGLRCT